MVAQPLVERREYGVKGKDQLENQFDDLKKLEPSLINSDLKRQFKARKLASEIMTDEYIKEIVNKTFRLAWSK